MIFLLTLKRHLTKNIYFILRKGKLSCLKFHTASSLDFFEVVSFYCPVSFALLFFCTPTQRIVKFDAIRVRTIFFFVCNCLIKSGLLSFRSFLFAIWRVRAHVFLVRIYFSIFLCVCARVFLTRQCGSVTRSNRESKKKGRGGDGRQKERVNNRHARFIAIVTLRRVKKKKGESRENSCVFSSLNISSLAFAAQSTHARENGFVHAFSWCIMHSEVA